MRNAFLLLTLLLTPFLSVSAPLTFKTECIGSYNISLPEQVEVALYPTYKYLEPNSAYPIEFSDIKTAYQSIFNYNHNLLKVTSIWESEVRLKEVQDILNEGITKTIEKNPNDLIVNIMQPHAIGYYSNFGSSITFPEQGRIYSFFTSKNYQGKERSFDFYQQNAEQILNGFSPRELFELPKQKGHCIPFGFVASERQDIEIYMGVSFRLVDHPDIIITFKQDTSPFTRNLKFDALEEMRQFWDFNYRNNDPAVKGIRLLGFPKHRNIKMDNRRGVAGFVEIIMNDNKPSDYGYYAVVGQRNVEHPWLQLYVLANASEAKGKTPLTKDEIYQLAKTIEASIVRRDKE